MLLHIWLLIAFIHLKTKKPKKNKPIEITMVQKGIPNKNIMPKAVPLPPIPLQKPIKQTPLKHHISKPHRKVNATRPKTQRYEALPSHILNSLPKSSYKPQKESSQQKEKPALKPSTPSPPSRPIAKEGQKHYNAKANLNLNIKQFVKKEESIYQYLSWLIRYLNKQARERDLYPKEAKKLGIKGEVVVRVTINKDGTIDKSSLKVVQSSGYKILDESAPKIIYELSPFKKPPKKITINLPVYFLINGYY
ncbi:energy transducer TonB [Hydrogenobaculum acidophilum]